MKKVSDAAEREGIGRKEAYMDRYDVTALGELLIDFTENGMSSQGKPLFEAKPGGAPCNVLAMLAKLGHRTAFVGKVGEDFFGKQLKASIEEVGISSEYLLTDQEVHTTLAMVHTLPGGDRDFSFYRNPGADMMLTEQEVPLELIRNSRIFHFGTLSMTHEAVRRATRRAVEEAKGNNVPISFDPNLRLPLWRSMEEAREQMEYGLSRCDILKIADNELQWYTGEEDFDRGIGRLKEVFDIPMILLSMGREGSRAYYKDIWVEVLAFRQEATIETTGAGDTFGACCLHSILQNGLKNFDEEKIREMLVFANAAASIVTTRKGALRVMPAAEEVKNFIESRRCGS